MPTAQQPQPTLTLTITPRAVEEVRKSIAAEQVSDETAGLRLFVDTFSAQYLGGIEVDYVRTFQSAGFTFNNPNATGGCGCGESFSV